MTDDFAERVRAKLGQLGSTGNFWKARQGPNRIRILPRLGFHHVDFFFQVAQHGNLEVDGRAMALTCFKKGNLTLCEFCTVAQFLLAQEDKQDRKLGSKIGVRTKNSFNMVDRAFPTEVKVFSFGPERTREIVAAMEDPEIGDIIDVKRGNDVIVNRTGTSLGTRYAVRIRERKTRLGLPGWKGMLHDLEHMAARTVTHDEAREILEENFGSQYDLDEILGGEYGRARPKKKVKRIHRRRDR